MTFATYQIDTGNPHYLALKELSSGWRQMSQQELAEALCQNRRRTEASLCQPGIRHQESL